LQSTASRKRGEDTRKGRWGDELKPPTEKDNGLKVEKENKSGGHRPVTVTQGMVQEQDDIG